MEGIKCSNCRLVNLASEYSCRRCGHEIGRSGSNRPQGADDASKIRSWLYTLLALTLIGGAAAYLYFGFEKSYTQIGSSEANRIAQQPKTQPLDQTRSQFEKQQAGHYGSAIQNSNGLAQSQKHVDDVEKLMAPQKDKTPK